MKWFTDLGPQLREVLKWPRPLPLEDERLRLLHEVCLILNDLNVRFSSILLLLLFVCLSILISNLLLMVEFHAFDILKFRLVGWT